MTAHPESVVGKMRRLIAADEAATSIFDYRDEEAYVTGATEHAPALLAALEKVWAKCGPDGVFDMRDCSAPVALKEVRAILAPLFESPEETT